MATPTSAVDICNLALTYIGNSTSVASLDAPDSSLESLLSLVYDNQRRVLLRKHNWNFAKNFETIARSGAGDDDYDDKYLLPDGCLKLISIGGDTDYSYEQRFDIKGRYVLLNNSGANSLDIRYIKDVDNVTLFDPLFIDLLALYVAKGVAFTLTKKPSIVEMIVAMIREQEQVAFSVDSQERPPNRITRSKTMARRFGSGIGSNADGYTRFYDIV